jgi:hypothetical protein
MNGGVGDSPLCGTKILGGQIHYNGLGKPVTTRRTNKINDLRDG